MNNKRIGYYSLVCYCKCMARKEVVNIGVVMLDEEKDFLECMFVKNYDRVGKMFSDINYDFLDQARICVEKRIKMLDKNKENLEKFINTRMNEIIMTSLCPIKIYDNNKQLIQLFKGLVE